MAVYGVGAEGSVLCVVGPWGAQSPGRECGRELSLGAAWALCMRDGSTCDSTDSRSHVCSLRFMPLDLKLSLFLHYTLDLS